MASISSGRGGRRVLVTHADQPLGRCLVKLLFYDDEVEHVLAVGSGAPPRSFDRFLSGSARRLRYARVDLAKHRPVADLFHSPSVRASGIDSAIHVPSHAAPSARLRPLLAHVAERTAEARLVLRHCLESDSIRRFVAIGSAFVYRLEPGNANRCTEASELNLDPTVPAELRSWVDCDMLFHAELHSQRLRVSLLRVPTVVATGGFVFMNPMLAASALPRIRALGFDPMCSVISDKDLARATRLALHSDRSGIYNVSSRETLPLSLLARWTGPADWRVPGPLLSGMARLAQLANAEWLRSRLDGAHLRYGFTLDTEHCERELGFRPGYRIGLVRSADGAMRLEASPV